MEGGRGTVLYPPPIFSLSHTHTYIYPLCISSLSLYIYTLSASLITFLHPSLVHAIFAAKVHLELLLVLESFVQGQGMQRRSNNVISFDFEDEVGTDDTARHGVIHLLFDLSLGARGERREGGKGGMT